METSPRTAYHTDARPTVNTAFSAAVPDGLPRASVSQFLRDDLDPQSQKPEPATFTRRFIQTVKASLTQIIELICSDRINVLLIFAPIGITVGFLDVDPIIDFILNALAIIPLAVVISTATESIASRLGDTLGALLNVTVGNTAELMIFFVALAKNQIRIVQASLLGSVLINLLLVLGTAFLAGGWRYHGQVEDRPAAHLSVCLLNLGLVVSMFPAAFLARTRQGSTDQTKREILDVSRGTSIGLIVVYMLYLIFQMSAQSDAHISSDPPDGMESFQLSQFHPTNAGRWPRWLSAFRSKDSRGEYAVASQTDEATNSLLRRTTSLDDLELTNQSEEDVEIGSARRSRSAGAKPNHLNHLTDDPTAQISWQDFSSGHHGRGLSNGSSISSRRDSFMTPNRIPSGLPPSPPSTPPNFSNVELGSIQQQFDSGHFRRGRLGMGTSLRRNNTLMEMYEYRRSRTQQSKTPFLVSVIVLVVATSIASVSTELAVDAIPTIVESWGVSQIFLGFIVLPVIGNAAEHIIAAKLALHNKMVLAKKVAIESGAQVVLFIMPVILIIAWIRGRELSLQFDVFEIAGIVMASLFASILVCRGKAEWKQGVLLHAIFWIIVLGAVIYPTTPELSGGRRTTT